MTLPITFFDPDRAMWPDLDQGVPMAPVRVGMDRFTGKVLIGWPHVLQSMSYIFSTRFHTRVLRRWVGSFVPHILGESAVERVITRFFWAIASAIELWEPNYRIKRVLLPPEDTIEQIRLGNWTFQTQGVYRPRAHLGDDTPFDRRSSGYVSRGNSMWDVA